MEFINQESTKEIFRADLDIFRLLQEKCFLEK